MHERICLILLDGSKGAGKTSVSNILVQCLEKTVSLSIDTERHALLNQEKNITELNKEAFEVIFEKIDSQLGKGLSVVVDCGLTEERVSRLESLARSKNVKTYKFFLDAPYEVLLERVRLRDESRGRQTDEKRFEEVFKIIHSKDLSEFLVIRTDILTLEEIAAKIISTLSPGK